jgi:hypothetical protein
MRIRKTFVRSSDDSTVLVLHFPCVKDLRLLDIPVNDPDRVGPLQVFRYKPAKQATEEAAFAKAYLEYGALTWRGASIWHRMRCISAFASQASRLSRRRPGWSPERLSELGLCFTARPLTRFSVPLLPKPQP